MRGPLTQPHDDARWMIVGDNPSRLVVTSEVNGTSTSVIVQQSGTSNSVTLDPFCVQTILYPNQKYAALYLGFLIVLIFV